jgi:hypothetical protein
MYTCEIHDGGEAPSFVLTPEDSPDKPIVSDIIININNNRELQAQQLRGL